MRQTWTFAFAALLLAGAPGCFLSRWGTVHGPPLPASTAATDLVVLVEDEVVADVCDDLDVFGRVDRVLDPWPASGAPPHAPDAWLHVEVEADVADAAQQVSRVYTVLMAVPFVASLGYACPLVVLRNERLVITARAGRDDDPWVRGEEVERVVVRYREGRVGWGFAFVCGLWPEPAPREVLEGALRLMAQRLAARRRARAR